MGAEVGYGTGGCIPELHRRGVGCPAGAFSEVVVELVAGELDGIVAGGEGVAGEVDGGSVGLERGEVEESAKEYFL